MMFLLITLLLAAGLVIITDLLAWQILLRTADKPMPAPAAWPAVAILLPVRNEQDYLPGCLQSLLALDYPRQKIHILIGNDASTDNTLQIALQWAQQHKQIKVFTISKALGLARAKANVLAQLVHHCPQEVAYFFMTDADIRPHPGWIRRLLQGMHTGVGIVNGTTAVAGNTRWARWQQTEWAVALGLAKAYTYLPGLGRTLTAIGNNMLISREAYSATGGYENIPFSITEDYELMRHVNQCGYKALQLMDRESSAYTEPVPTFKALLHQRKRWATGALRLPPLMILLLLLQALFFPAVAVILWLKPLAGLGLLLLKLAVQYLLVKRVLSRLGIAQQPLSGVFYEFYNLVINVSLLVFYVLPLKISWKGRNYQNNRH